MNSRHMKGLIIASCVASLGLAGAIGGTYALFSRKLEVVSHVKVGNLNFSFVRTSLKQKVLNDKGYLEEKVDTSVVDLTSDGAKAFDLDGVVPGSEIESTFKLANIGGTAFKTEVNLVNLEVKDKDGNAAENDWLSHVSVKCLEAESEKASFTLKDLGTVNLSNLEKGKELTFSLKFSFDLDAIGNEAQEEDISFALRLSCTQIVSE